MRVREIYNQLIDTVALASWPEVEHLFPDLDSPARLDWRLPIYSIQAVNLYTPDPLPLVAAVACLQMSIILVDDILDNDPRGKHLEMGTGRASNLALALQSAAHLLLQEMSLPASRTNQLATTLQRMAFQTSVGQEIDVQEIADEAAYWALVQAKSTPFYGAVLESGAIVAGAPPEMCAAIYHIGAIFGEIIQIMDDITDAFERPAKPDWIRQNNNLIILYAKTAQHPDRKQFQSHLVKIDSLEVLDSAQTLLVKSGGVSYGIYHIINRYEQALSILQEANVNNAAAITELLFQQIAPLRSFLENIGLEIPEVIKNQ